MKTLLIVHHSMTGGTAQLAQAALRGAGMGVVNRIGPARRFFMQEAGGATGDLPRLLRGESL